MREHEYSGRLMGCELSISLVTDSKEYAQESFEHMLAIGCAYEDRFSRFKDDSELSRLNRAKQAVVSPELLDALMQARELYIQTHGVFNVLLQVGAALGYTHDFATLGVEGVSEECAVYDTDLSAVTVIPHTRMVTLRQKQQLDFGGCIKGHVAEVMAKSVENISGVVVNIGGDIFTCGTDVDGSPFRFSVYDPTTDAYPCALSVVNAAIATSGTYRRTWKRAGVSVHHILGPSGNQNPPSDLISATVVHPVGYTADAYATVAVSVGSVAASTFLREQRLEFVLIMKDGRRIVQNAL